MINRKFVMTFSFFLLLAESMSFLVHLIPGLRVITFVLVCLLLLFFSLKNLKYGVYAVLAELILGSKGGYLFYLNVGGSLVSMRMALWIIILSVWTIKYFLPVVLKKKKGKIFPVGYDWFKYSVVLMLFILWGLANSFFQGNEFTNIFFDFNGYLYLLIFFPLISLIKDDDRKKNSETSDSLLMIFGLASFWISVKTLIILFLFSHKLEYLNSILYSWIRTSGVGEITQMEGGFYRVFFQSHIFVIILLISLIMIFVSNLLKNEKRLSDSVRNKNVLMILLTLVVLSASVFVSMSRSNWVGLIIAIIASLAYLIWKYRLRGLFTGLGTMFIVGVLSYSLIMLLVRFPYPKPLGGFEAGDIFAERASELTSEAGVSSRWNLLPELYNKIKEAPLQGSGFGATVTYISNDPRVRTVSKDGVYTTFAFEWGWLDIWIKLGFFGFLAYVSFLLKISYRAFRLGYADTGKNQELYFSIVLSLLCLGAINFFSPYLNHPLGIGLVLFGLLFMESLAKGEKSEILKSGE